MKRKVTFVVILAILLCGALVLAGCSKSNTGSSTSGKTINIGWVAPLTGTAADDGNQMLNGAKMAASEINAAGGINGAQITIMPQDDQSNPTEAANIATKFTADTSIVAVLGNYNSSCVLAGAPIYDQAMLPVIHVGTSPEFSTMSLPYMFRISMTDAFQGGFVTDWMTSDGHTKVAIMYENDDYGNGLKSVVQSEMTKDGGSVTGTYSYDLGQTKDFTPLLTSIKGSGAQAIFIGGLYTEGALICKQAQQLGMNLPFYGTDGLYEQDLITLGGSAVNGIKVSGLFLPNSTVPAVATFVASYKAAYSNSTPGTYAALDYDAMKLLAQGITQVGTDHQKLQAWLANMPAPYAGVTGSLSFNAQHDCARATVNKLTVQNGQWVLFTPPTT